MNQHNNLKSSQSLQFKAVQAILVEYFGEKGSLLVKDKLKTIKLSKGTQLFKEGDEGHHMYIVLSGTLDVLIGQAGKLCVVGTVMRAESVGEMALLGNGIRTADVIARRDSLLLELKDEDFNDIVKVDNTLLFHLNKIAIQRLDQANKGEEKAENKSKFIALESISPSITSKIFAERIQEYWKGTKSTLLVEESSIQDGNEDLSLIINDYEKYDYVFMISNHSAEWNQLIRANADKVVYLAEENDAALWSHSINQQLSQHDEIVLFCRGETPQLIDQWLTIFSPNKIFRTNDSAEHNARMARIICETAICIVFGGGGAHGLANLGVVRTMHDHGIPIDIIGGTSIGSIFGGAFAQDWDYDYIYKNVEMDLSKHNPLNDYTLPFVALLRGRRMAKVLKKHFHIEIVNSWKNYFSVAANLSKALTEIIEEGPMDKAIAASISIPGILPPCLHRNSLLIDGGVLNNLPADVMKKLYKGHIISIDVVSNKARSIEHVYSVGNWQYIRNMITGKKKNYVPGTMNTLMKAVTLASAEKSSDKEAISDIYIKPRIKKGFLAWKEMDAFVKAGKEATEEALMDLQVHTLLELPKH